MTKKVLFIDRDGTLIREPADEQVDALDKIELMPGVIAALLELRRAGYELVIVSNQDGLGTASFPTEQFESVRGFLLRLFESQGIDFAAEFYCPHLESDGCKCRKPRLGLLSEYLSENPVDRAASAVIGDRDTDLELARNLGLKGFRLSDECFEETWDGIRHLLLDQPRTAVVDRTTNETSIHVAVDLDREASAEVETGIGFLDHMLEQLGRHGGFALTLSCKGDLHVDEHHTVEDSALALGEALRTALGDRRGIGRYGFVLPMDEAEAQVSIDLGGRPYLIFEGRFDRERVGDLPTELVEHFFRSLSETLRAAIHIRLRGDNTHHLVESAFKGFARCFSQAAKQEGLELPTTKGVL